MSNNGLVRRAAYVFHGVRRRFGRAYPKLKDLASEVRELAPSEEGVMAAPITLPGHAGRATGNAFGEVAKYVKWATMTTCTHSPTLLYRVENVVLDNGVIYKGTLAEQISSLGGPRSRRPEAYAEQMVLTSSESGSSFFGDWLTADSPVELLANSLGIAPLKVQPRIHYPHQQHLSRLLNLEKGFSDMVAVRNLYIVDDAGYNTNKRDRLRALRSNIRVNAGLSDSKNDLVYLCRGEGHQAARRLMNEDEVKDLLARHGFQIVDPSKMSAAAVLAATSNCRVVVGVEGSQLAYGFLGLVEGGLMMTLQPPYRFDTSWRPRCVFVGVDWGFIVGIEANGGFTISLSELEEVLSAFV